MNLMNKPSRTKAKLACDNSMVNDILLETVITMLRDEVRACREETAARMAKLEADVAEMDRNLTAHLAVDPTYEPLLPMDRSHVETNGESK